MAQPFRGVVFGSYLCEVEANLLLSNSNFSPSLVATDDAAAEFWKILRATLRSIAGKMWEKRRDCIFLMLPKTT